MKKQNLEMLQLLESIEVMLQNGNSIHPDSVIRGAIRIAIGMDQYGMPEGLDTPEKHEQYLKDIGLMKTAVEWLIDTINKINHDYEVGIIDETLWSIQTYDAHKQAKEMEKEQHGKTWDTALDKYEVRAGNYMRAYEDFDEYYNETFKSE